MEIQLKNIFVGDPDGLAEAQKAQFNDLFYKKNKKYEELEKNPNKFIVTGRKGTGKTLLAKYYELQMKAEHGVAKYIDNHWKWIGSPKRKSLFYNVCNTKRNF